MVLDWAGDRVDRRRLETIARQRIADYAPIWRECACAEPTEERRALAG